MRTNKKGFTITELVIVIVVIAILAAVLIPTFASLIKKANVSADTQLAKNLNTALAVAEATDGKVDDFSEVLSAARDAGYIISNLNPTAENCYFVWESETNQFLLVDGEENYEVIFAAKEDYPAIGETWHFATADREVAEMLKEDETLKAAKVKVMDMYADAEDVSAALAAGGTQTLYIDESVVLDDNNTLTVDKEDADIVIEMSNSSLNTNGILKNVPVLANKGKLTVNGGIVDGTGEFENEHGKFDTSVAVDYSAELVLNNMKISGVGSAVATNLVAYGNSKLTISNSTLTAQDHCLNITGGSTAIANDVKATSAVPVFVTQKSTLTINGGEYNYTGEETRQWKLSNICFYINPNDGSKLIITGGTFNGKTFAELDTEDEWKALCNAGVTITGVGTDTVTITH